MKMTYSIKTVLRKDKIKADGMIPIYYAVRVGPTTSRIPTGKSIALKDWDGKNDCPKRNNKINDLLNDHFTKIMSDWKFAMLQKESMGKTITLNIAQEQFKAKPKVTFYSFFAEQIELWQNQKTASTLRTYRSTLNVLKAFDPKANFGDLDLTWIEKFDLYLSNVRKNSVGGRFGRHKNLRAILHAAVKKGLIPASAHPYEHFSIKAAKGNRQFLTVEELQKVIKVNLPEEDIMLEKVKDLFLFSVFTGLRYSDVQNLQWQHINPENIEINMKMKKTGSMIEVPIISDAMKITEKYGKHSIKSPSATILPQISNQVVNRNLKLIMERARIKKSISFHCARHTFATLANQAGTNIVHLQKLLGHVQIGDTMIYTHLNKADLHNSMDRLQSLYKKAL